MNRHTTFNDEVERLLDALTHHDVAIPTDTGEKRGGGVQHNANQCLQRTLAVGRGVPCPGPAAKPAPRTKSDGNKANERPPPAQVGSQRRWSDPKARTSTKSPEEARTLRYQSAPTRGEPTSPLLTKASSKAEAPLRPRLDVKNRSPSPVIPNPTTEGKDEQNNDELKDQSPKWLRILISENTKGQPSATKPTAQATEDGSLALAQWLQHLGMESYLSHFAANGITQLNQLMQMSEAKLKTLVPKLSDRRPIAIAIAKLQTDVSLHSALQGLQEMRLALLIGNSTYAHYPPVSKAAADVEALGALLRQQLNFHTMTLTDATVAQVTAACDRFVIQSQRCKGPVILIYYTGHAVQLDGQNYLLPVDCPRPLPNNRHTELLQLHELVSHLIRGQPSLTLVFLDASRDNQLMEHLNGSQAPHPGAGPLYQLRPIPVHPFKANVSENATEEASHKEKTPPGTLKGTMVTKEGLAPFSLEAYNVCVMLSASPNQLAADVKEKEPTTLFCGSVMRHFAKQSVPISVTMQDISAEVQALTLQKQRPWVMYRADGPQFYLLPPEGTSRPNAGDQLTWPGWD